MGIPDIAYNIMEELDLRNDFIMRMKDIDLEESIMVEDFGERYGLTQCLDLP